MESLWNANDFKGYIDEFLKQYKIVKKEGVKMKTHLQMLPHQIRCLAKSCIPVCTKILIRDGEMSPF